MKFHFLTTILLLSLYSCSKNIESEDCISTKLVEAEMIKYEGQSLDDKDFLKLYLFQNNEYFVLDNYSADIAVCPTDCNGEKLCDKNDLIQKEFYDFAEFIRIVGVSKD